MERAWRCQSFCKLLFIAQPDFLYDDMSRDAAPVSFSFPGPQQSHSDLLVGAMEDQIQYFWRCHVHKSQGDSYRFQDEFISPVSR